MLLVHCLASRVCQKLTFNTFPVVPELSAVMCPRGSLASAEDSGLSLKAKDLGPKAKAKAKDFVIKANAKDFVIKATALCPRGASMTRSSPRGHITANCHRATY